MNWQNMFSIGKANSVHTAELMALGKSLNIDINYLMFYPRRQHVK